MCGVGMWGCGVWVTMRVWGVSVRVDVGAGVGVVVHETRFWHALASVPAALQALLDDLVGLHLRKVTLPGVPVPGDTHGRIGPPKSYDLDLRADAFWAKHCREPFPNAIEGQEAELKASGLCS
jgi:hypothetical protein